MIYLQQQTTGGATGLTGVLEGVGSEHADRPAIHARCQGAERSVSYAELAAHVRVAAGRLVLGGVRPGDRVAVLAPCGAEWVVGFLAGWRAGAVAVALDASGSPQSRQAVVDDCDPALIVTTPALRAAAAELGRPVHVLDALPPAAPGRADLEAVAAPARDRSLHHVALLCYTSGTTGEPRAVEVTGRTLLFEASTLAGVLDVGPGDVVQAVLPPHHMLGLVGGILAPLASGAAVCFAESLMPHAIAAGARTAGATLMVGVPLLWRALAAACAADGSAGDAAAARAWCGPSLRFLVSGGAPLDATVAAMFESWGIPVLEGYGLTESGPVVAVNTLRERRAGTVGRALPGVEIRLCDTGDGPEVLTRGPHIMAGYRNDPAATHQVIDPQGWLHTGDLGEIAGDGYLRITGRRKLLLVLADGKKVQPEAVEAALVRAPEIAEACVVGARARGGLRDGTEAVCAVVVPAGRTEEAGVGASCRRAVEGLARHEQPARVLIHPGPLPMTRSGKHDRRAIRAWAEAQA